MFRSAQSQSLDVFCHVAHELFSPVSNKRADFYHLDTYRFAYEGRMTQTRQLLAVCLNFLTLSEIQTFMRIHRVTNPAYTETISIYTAYDYPTMRWY